LAELCDVQRSFSKYSSNPNSATQPTDDTRQQMVKCRTLRSHTFTAWEKGITKSPGTTGLVVGFQLRNNGLQNRNRGLQISQNYEDDSHILTLRAYNSAWLNNNNITNIKSVITILLLHNMKTALFLFVEENNSITVSRTSSVQATICHQITSTIWDSGIFSIIKQNVIKLSQHSDHLWGSPTFLCNWHWGLFTLQ
jgi:hypothetical protein